MKSKPASFSETTITELMIPSYANFSGKIHGGILLSLMDKVAFACASKHSGEYCVTVSVEGVEFFQPVEVGELVSLTGSVIYVGKTSMIVGIHIESMKPKTGETNWVKNILNSTLKSGWQKSLSIEMTGKNGMTVCVKYYLCGESIQ